MKRVNLPTNSIESKQTLKGCDIIEARLNANNLMMVWLWFALNGLDVITSHLCIHAGAIEINPLISGVASSYGEIAGWGLKLTLAALVVPLLFKFDKIHILKRLNQIWIIIILFNIATLTYCLLV